MSKDSIENRIDAVLRTYQESFSGKTYAEENNDHDFLMDLFGISSSLKRENRQYWGRELGMCWQRVVIEICSSACKEFGPAIRFGADEPCDLTVGKIAIDTKYRIGSGDSGTLKKFKSYGALLRENGYTPVFLIVREDNLPAAIQACKVGTWEVYTGNDTFNYIQKLTGFAIKQYLSARVGDYSIQR